jgi:hypothetical protein
VSISLARRLLDEAASTADRVRRHLLVATALQAAYPHRVVVVGGAAEDYWANDQYTPTDLDATGDALPELLVKLGFRRDTDRRHWYHAPSDVVVEFPVERLAGDWDRIVEIPLGQGSAWVISLEDLYLDRLSQSTAQEVGWADGREFKAALAIAAARADQMDWGYVRRLIRESALRSQLETRHRAVRRRIRQAVTSPEHSVSE